MATLYFAVFSGAVEVASGDPIQENVVSIGVASAQSAAIAGADRKRRRVRIFADSDCFAIWGENPTALANGLGGRPLSAGSAEYFDIEAGHKIATSERT